MRMPAPINQPLMMNPLQYKFKFLMFIHLINHVFDGTHD